MPAIVHEYSLLILEHHLDTFGHVNNATYLALFEEARWDFMTRREYGIERIRQTRRGPVALECSVRFRRELTSRVKVTIATSTTSYVGKIARMRHEMRLADGSVACDADFTLGLFDLDRRKLIEPTPAWLDCLGLAPEDWQPSGATGA